MRERTTYGYGSKPIPLLCWLTAWEHRGLAYNALRRRGVPAWDHDAWFSDVCLGTLVRCVMQWRPGAATFSTYATRALLRNIGGALRWYRSGRCLAVQDNEQEIDHELEAPRTEAPDEVAMGKEAAALISELDDKDASILWLTYWVDVEDNRQAALLGVSHTTIANRRRSALAELRRRITGRWCRRSDYATASERP